MNPTLIAGIAIVNLALVAYTIGVIAEQRRRRVTRLAISFLTIGIVLDIVATTCMIVGSANTPFSVHGFVGYSSLLGMLIETALAWRHRLKEGEGEVSHKLHLYTRLAYAWWVLAYITGATIVAMSRSGS